MGWNGTKTWAVGEVWTAGDANSYIRDNTAFLHDAPSWSVYRTTNQAFGTGVLGAITFDAERRDTNAFHSLVTNTSRCTIPTGLAGMYGMTVGIEWAASAAGNQRACNIRINGVTYIAAQAVPPPGAGVTQFTATRIYPLAQGDYVEAIGFQDSGGNLNVNSQGNYSPEFAGQWLAS